MANQQKRMLSSAKSKLGKADLPVILRKEDAWDTLPAETRQSLYNLLPEPGDGEPAHDIAVNPLKTSYRSYIEAELRLFQEDLKDGKEGKKWRADAMEAGAELRTGKFDEFKAMDREEKWGTTVQDQDQEGEEQEFYEEDDGEQIENGKPGLASRMDFPQGLLMENDSQVATEMKSEDANDDENSSNDQPGLNGRRVANGKTRDDDNSSNKESELNRAPVANGEAEDDGNTSNNQSELDGLACREW